MSVTYLGMALDSHGRVLRRPNWYSAGEYANLRHNYDQLVTSRDHWKSKYAMTQLPQPSQPVKIRCRRRLIPLVKLLLGE